MARPSATSSRMRAQADAGEDHAERARPRPARRARRRARCRARRAPRRRSRHRAPGAPAAGWPRRAWPLPASAVTAARRLALSGDETRMAARMRSSAAFSAASVSAAQAFSISGSCASSSCSLQQLGDAGAARVEVGREQLQRGQRGLQLAAHAVVVDHVLGVVGQRGRGAGGGVDRLVVAHDEDLVAGDLHLVVEQRLHERRRARRRRSAARLVQRGDALVAVARRRWPAPAAASARRPRAAAHEQQAAENESSKHAMTVQRKTRTGRQPVRTLKRTPRIRLCRSAGVAPLGGSAVRRYGGVTSSRARSSCPCSRRCSRSTGRPRPGPGSSTPR